MLYLYSIWHVLLTTRKNPLTYTDVLRDFIQQDNKDAQLDIDMLNHIERIIYK